MAQILVKNRMFPVIACARGFANSLLLKSNKVPEEVIPKNILEEYIIAHKQPNGKIYDKRPFKMKLQANKKYYWCSCGQSKSQPLCDGTHRIYPLQIEHEPVPFMVDETKDYWLCNCKQSLHKPFCDGTHLNTEIQSAVKNFKM